MTIRADLMNIEIVAEVENLLAHFLIGALGLKLEAMVPEACHANQRRLDQDFVPVPSSTTRVGIEAPICVGWTTNAGLVTACGVYDGAQSLKLGEHVIYIEWWMAPAIHHKGWWRCPPKRPREWTKGRGRYP